MPELVAALPAPVPISAGASADSGLRVAPLRRRTLKEYLVRQCREGMVSRRGLLFRLAAIEDGQIVGVVAVGRPNVRVTRHPRIAAVWQLVVDCGRADARAILLAAAARTASGMGLTGLVTDRCYRRAAEALTRAGAELYGSTSLLRFRGADAGLTLGLARGWVWRLGVST